MTLRDEIAKAIDDAWNNETDDLNPWDAADRILAIPELRDALLLMNTAMRRFGEAARQADPSHFAADAYMNAHPWANLLKPEDMPSGSDHPPPSAE